uniref:MYM-type domain-containing protein n=1 Tax=viral metagenome TaxID=1070528 RepID=A0A6C0H4Z6_9ZZZZ
MEIMEESHNKKRGRKPRGGKIIECNNAIINDNMQVLPNIILHLICGLKDLNENQKEIVVENNVVNLDDKNDLNNKLDKLKIKLNKNEINKKSACFYCTYDFDNHPYYVIKSIKNGQLYGYGNFCHPCCAVGYLLGEKIDVSMMVERYQLTNYTYGKILDYTENIKPAPNPHYILKRFQGNLEIDEYRNLFEKKSIFLVINKPINCILPEIFEDNEKPVLELNLLQSR